MSKYNDDYLAIFNILAYILHSYQLIDTIKE